MSNIIKIAVVEDDYNFRMSLVGQIREIDDFRCEHSFPDAESFIKFLDEGGEVDVLLLDIRLGGMSGLEALEPVLQRRAELKILILTIFDDNPSIKWALRAGARGYLLKGATREEIIHHIDCVNKGYIIFSVDVSRSLLKEAMRDSTTYNLSPREMDVLKLLAKGFKNQKIADSIFISVSTVLSHLGHIYEKMQVNNRSEAIRKALREGLVD